MLHCDQIINDLFHSNTYILYSDESDWAWLIDCGDFNKVNKWLNHSKKILKGIFVTHSHFDHVYGINNALEVYPNIPIYVSENDGMKIIADEKLNGSRYAEIPFNVIDANFIEIKDGSSIRLASNYVVDILKTVGHSEDSVSYISRPFVFTGDAFIPNIRTVSKLKGGDKEKAQETVRNIYKKCESDMIICPGHNEMCNIKDVYIEKMF